MRRMKPVDHQTMNLRSRLRVLKKSEQEETSKIQMSYSPFSSSPPESSPARFRKY